MTSFGRLVRIILSVVALAAIGAVVLVQFTDYCRLKAVTLDGRPVTDFPSRYSLDPAHTIADQPIEKVASQLLDEHGIVKVDINYGLPCSLSISTNDFTPDCLVVDKSSGYIYGLDGDGRVIPIKDSSQIWNLPLLTGCRMFRLYSFCDDIRTQFLVPRLHELRSENPNEYEMIEEIDFSDSLYLAVTVSGIPYPVKATADDFAEQMHQFFMFMSTYNPDMSAATTVDLRFAPMIVRVGQPPDSAELAQMEKKKLEKAERAVKEAQRTEAANAVPAKAGAVKNAAGDSKTADHKKPADTKKSANSRKAGQNSKPVGAKKPTAPKKTGGSVKKTGGRG